jgi:hypothetical protein
MKINIAVMMCAALGLPGVIFGQHHAPPATPTAEQSITGDWVIHFQAGHESVSGSLHLQADGERLAGTVETGHTGPGTVENGKWSKQKLEATLVLKKHESVVLEGELKSNGTLAGNYTTEGRTETWQAERKSATALNSSSGVYAQYEALIGTWDVTAPDGGPSFAVQRFTWGRAILIYGMRAVSSGRVARKIRTSKECWSGMVSTRTSICSSPWI